MTPDKIISDLEDLIEARITEFNKSMPAVERKVLQEIELLAKDLETYSDGTIKANAKNVRLIVKIRQRIQQIIFDGQYGKKLNELVKTYEDIGKLQNAYFSATVDQFKIPAVLAELEKQAISMTVESLGEAGMNVNVLTPVQQILNKNITTGGKYKDFIQEVRGYLTTDNETEGRLVRYSKQITTDALNQYSASYNKVISDDLGLEWYRYSGSLRKTSREFCVKMIEAKKGCMPYLHVSQIPELLKGHICGESIPLYDKTGLPQGMIAGTNTANFYVNRGGYSCNHQITAVPSVLVPEDLRKQFEK